MKAVRVGVIGAGIMGANHARVLRQLPEAVLTAVVDQDLERANLVVGPEGRGVVDLAEVIDEIDAAVVAVPTKFHHDITLQLLRAGKHVLVEKPIAATEVEAKAMVEAAEELGLVFAVGHIERFNPAVVELSKWIENPVHIRIERINPYSGRILDGVVMDLMIHDLDIVLSLADGAEVVDVEGIGHHVRSDSEDLAVVTLRFANGLTASLTTSRLGQQKIRQIEVTQHESVVVADLLRQDITINRMTRSEYLSNEGTRYRQSSMVEIPFLEVRGEPLALELSHFIECILTDGLPRVDGEAGLRALRLASYISSRISRTERG
jgi:predicted dehydrogenase